MNTILLPLLGVLLVGISAVTTASVALAGVKLRHRDRAVLWATTTALALVLVVVFTQTLISTFESR